MAKSSRPGCLFWAIILVGIGICIWATGASGLGKALIHNQPLIPITVPKLSLPGGLNLAQPSQAQADSSSVVTGPPTLSAAFVNQVLAKAHSPAQGTGVALYTLSQQYGVDDAYALAFFQHESHFGTTGVARVTRSLGNIRCSPGYPCLDGFRAYATWEQGYQDWYALIRNLYVDQWHRVTIAQIVPIYAPASDGNDPASYIAAVEQAVTMWRRGEVSL